MKTAKNSRARTLGDLGERGFIKTLLPSQSRLSSFFLVPPGDDAVVLRGPGRPVLSIDGLTEGTHFRLRWADRCERIGGFSLGRGLGWKILGCSLSDLAAMGATTRRWAMIYLGAPGKTKTSFLRDLQQGTSEAARQFDCAMAGGDTVKANELSLVAAVGGDLAGSRALRRSGAHLGDLICVTGYVGDALAGLNVLEDKIKIRSNADAAHFVKRFFKHEPMFEAGAALSSETGVTSAMDLSDALSESVDLLCEASRVGAHVNLNSIPVSPAYRRSFDIDSRLLIGGEDYGLIFTLRAACLSGLRRRLVFSVIGRIVARSEGRSYYLHGRQLSPPASFRHFK